MFKMFVKNLVVPATFGGVSSAVAEELDTSQVMKPVSHSLAGPMFFFAALE